MAQAESPAVKNPLNDNAANPQSKHHRWQLNPRLNWQWTAPQIAGREYFRVTPAAEVRLREKFS
jgi:hypothetical protein